MPETVTRITEEYKRPVQSEHDLSGALISVEQSEEFPGYLQVVFGDIPKSNFNPMNLSFVRLAANTANYTAFVGCAVGVDLFPAQKFIIGEIRFSVNAYRGKGGWAGFLSKTSKSINEESLLQKAEQMQANEVKKGFFSRGKKEGGQA